ncbi:prolyl oligopeptidase family serine peptidase [Caldibacillus lycopersici]|uniref:prolyl oligopeptidase n=1 Tax=Perspicuibacillus lycopersici TaxID=1325689 RepID=A0AAE3LN40_9BACI|nr:prolyl oligopeptidase family serine peptidase [Perspicuibacillus lycopersici]MCU9613556.1 prolyl oligopeptidase family serine peptidase [Perspicuibacillus lycopersici]
MKIIHKSNIVEDFHGTKVADPYRWLEDATSKETIAWSEEQNRKSAEYFSHSPNAEEDRKRLTDLWDYPKHFVPKKVKNILFYQKNDGLQNQAILYQFVDGEESIVLDPNLLSDDGTVALSNYSISKHANYMAYAVSVHGSDWQNILVKDLTTKKDLEDKIEWVKFTSIAWLPDESGFYYSKLPEPGTVAPEDESKYNKVYFHKLNTPQSEDQLVFAHPTNKELMFYPFISDDENYLCLNVHLGTATENAFYVKKLADNSPFVYLLDELDASYEYVTNEGELFYFQTNLQAPNGRIVSLNIEQTELAFQEVVPEQNNLLDGIKYIAGKFVIAYLQDAHHQLHLYGIDGEYLREIKLPVIGSLTNITGNVTDSEIYFGLTSFLTPTVVYHYEVEKDELSVFAQSELNFDPSLYETRQVFYPSKDGTKVPMFITCKKDIVLNGENPVILYGYGGFNINMTPAFSPAYLRWLEKGGVYAVANLRGGTEYGEEWHRGGMLENKQNVFDDFSSAGEWLIDNNYTRKGKLSIMGGSNGGLLVAASMVQRPDLFGAVICRVPVIDMLRYHKFTVGRYWIPEYGDPSIPEHFQFLYAYSPLHNIKEGVLYPPVLIATAESDDRVVPAHAKKFAATLLEKANPNSKVLLRLESKAGHGHGKPTSKIIDEWVDFFAFLDKELC